MIDWDEKARTAQAKVAAVGAPATLQRLATQVYDPDTDTTVSTEGNVSCHAVLSTSTIAGDDGRLMVAMTATLNAEPKSTDTLVIGTTSYRVVKTLTIAPGGVPLLWSAVLET